MNENLQVYLPRSDEFEEIAEQNITRPVSLRRKYFSSRSPVSKSIEFLKTPDKKKKLRTFRSRVLFTFRSLRENHHFTRQTSSSDVIKTQSTENCSEDKFHEQISQSDNSSVNISSVVVRKEKNSLAKRFSLTNIRRKKKKIFEENVTTNATQTSPSPPALLCAENISCPNRTKDQVIGEQVKKIQITIFGRKTEFKIPATPEKSLGIESSEAEPVSSEDLSKLFNTGSERDISPSERAHPFQHYGDNISTVASSRNPPSESIAQQNIAFGEDLVVPRLERQASIEKFAEEEKFQFMRHDHCQERGSRFPRPTCTDQFQSSSNLSGERFDRVHDYVNKTRLQNNLYESVVDEVAPVSSPDENFRRLSPAPLLREITANKNNSSYFESASSNEICESPVSDAGRRRIKYVGQPTFYTDEEKELLERKREAFRNLAGISEYSFESDFTSESGMPAYGDLVLEFPEAPIMTSGTEKREHLYKILVIGELGAGKTSFIKRYVHQFFSANYRATIGVDFALKVLHWDQNTIVRLQLWDIAGQERFGNMTRVYYKEAVGAFIVFDVTRSGTFDAVTKWKEDLDSKVQLPGGESIPCILLANKCDQDKQGLVTDAEKMDEYVRDNGFSGWLETSAKENINIEEAARALVSQILLNDKLITAADVIDHDKFALDITNRKRVTSIEKKSCSC